MKPEGLTITKIVAENILKFERFSLDQPGKLTLFKGQNNLGKTTALKLLSLAVKGSAAPQSIIHDGADKGEIILDFSGYKLRRSFTEKGQYLKITDDDGRILPNPQKWLNDRIGEFRDFNPLAWLGLANSDSAEDRRRAVAVLLRAINVTLSPEEFTEATGLPVPSGIDFGQHGLVVLDALREHFADERKIENRTADQKRKAADELQPTLPAERPVITDERRAEAAKVLAEAKNAAESINARRLAATAHVEAVDRLHGAIDREVESQKRIGAEITEFESEIDAIQRKIASRREQIGASVDREAALHEDVAKLANSAPPTQAEIDAANAEIRRANTLTTSIKEDEKVLDRFTSFDALTEEADTAAVRASIVDSTIKVISGELRAQLLAKAKLPVGALAIDGDVITVDGHPIGNAAESQQIRVALAIARSLNPKLKVIILDGSERLDAATFNAFLEETRGDGFTYFASEVDRDGTALEVITFGEDGVVTPAAAEVA